MGCLAAIPMARSAQEPQADRRRRSPGRRCAAKDDRARQRRAARHPITSALLPETRAQISTPILWNEGIVGVITLESDQLNAFSEEDSYFVQQLANQAIIAIENARLFRKVVGSARPDAGDPEHGQRSADPDQHGGRSRAGESARRTDGLAAGDADRQVARPAAGNRRTASGRSGSASARASELQRLVKELRAPGGLAAREPKVFTRRRGGQPRYIERQVFPVYDEAEQPLGVLLVFYDETEEMRLAKTREEVSQMLIHDLRSPLTAVTTSLKLLTRTDAERQRHPPDGRIDHRRRSAGDWQAAQPRRFAAGRVADGKRLHGARNEADRTGDAGR